MCRGNPWTTLSEFFSFPCILLGYGRAANMGAGSTENEKRLGRIIRAKYDTDYFIIDKFPMELRPFYTMPDPNDPVSHSSFLLYQKLRGD